MPDAACSEANDLRDVERRVLECLGAALVGEWNDLPTDVQRRLFVYRGDGLAAVHGPGLRQISKAGFGSINRNNQSPGGVHQDLPPKLIDDIEAFCNPFLKVVDDLDRLLTG